MSAATAAALVERSAARQLSSVKAARCLHASSNSLELLPLSAPSRSFSSCASASTSSSRTSTSSKSQSNSNFHFNPSPSFSFSFRPTRPSLDACFSRKYASTWLPGSSELDKRFTATGKDAEMVAAVGRGRMDQALKIARELTATDDGQTPSPMVVHKAAADYLAKECSEQAAVAYLNGAESRQRGRDLAVSGATFELPGRVRVKPGNLAESFWLREVSNEYDQALFLQRLCKASITLQGLETLHPEDLAKLTPEQVAVAARSWQLLGKLAPIQLQTCRIFCVLNAYISREFNQNAANIGRYPVLFALMMKAGRHLQSNLVDVEPLGLLDGVDDDRSRDLSFWKDWSDRRQAAASEHMGIIAEVISEAAAKFYVQKEEASGLLDVAAIFYRVECPLAQRKEALSIFRDTAKRL